MDYIRNCEETLVGTITVDNVVVFRGQRIKLVVNFSSFEFRNLAVSLRLVSCSLKITDSSETSKGFFKR